MPMWKPGRNPDKYPAHWHGIVTAQPGQYIAVTVASEEDARREAKRFSAFKATLRAHPLHPTAKALAKRKVRTRVEPGQGFWALGVTVVWATDLLTDIEAQLNAAPPGGGKAHWEKG